jgi:hypothetical protein
MKKHALIFALTLGGIFVFAQATEKKAVFNVVKTNKVIAVSPTKMAVLYIGIDNPIEIAISDMLIKYITATVDSGEIENQGEGKFIVKINKSISATKINVFETFNGITTKVGERLFRVKRIPSPVVTIAGIRNGIISKDVLLSSGVLIPVMENFDFDLFFKISAFTMTINTGGDLLEENAVGNQLTPSMISKIARLPKGSKIYFENIQAIDPDNKTRALCPIVLKLI